MSEIIVSSSLLIRRNEGAKLGFWCRLDNKYKHILFDEFQDTDEAQWEIIKSWLGAYGKYDDNKPKIFYKLNSSS